jgi:hypothetical protein
MHLMFTCTEFWSYFVKGSSSVLVSEPCTSTRLLILSVAECKASSMWCTHHHKSPIPTKSRVQIILLCSLYSSAYYSRYTVVFHSWFSTPVRGKVRSYRPSVVSAILLHRLKACWNRDTTLLPNMWMFFFFYADVICHLVNPSNFKVM